MQHPEELFRRVRDKKSGNLKLSENAKAFSPGRGVYRSSYKNALRLARTETNMAYRTADFERINQLDFVVGIRVVLSNNHTSLGADGKAHDLYDICDELQGDYPKDFKFVGWHPHCRCHVETILKTDEEFDADNARILNGEEPQSGSVNEVKQVPANFKDWIENNIERAKGRASLPYFIADNPKQVAQAIGIYTEPKKTPLEIAKERHEARTEDDIAAIQEAWNRRRLFNAIDGVEQLYIFHNRKFQKLVQLLEEEISLHNHKSFERNFAEMQRAITEVRNIEYMKTEHLMKTSLFKANNEALEATFGARGTAMPFKSANEMRGNPHFAEAEAYRVNCQTCVVANEMRRRGFNVEALPNIKGSALEKLSYHTESVWIDANGNIPKSGTTLWVKRKRMCFDGTVKGVWEMCKTRKQLVAALENEITEDGRYHIKWSWAKIGKGHIITVERIKGRFRYYDPQTGKVVTNFVGYIKNIDISRGIKWLRVDTLRINPEVAKKVLTKPTTKAKFGKAATGGTSAKLRKITASECNITLQNGGRVSTPKARLVKGNSNKQSQAIFEKELRMAKRFANGGHKIEFTADDAGSFDVLIDGEKADFKSTSSPGNIVKYAKHATRDQGAEIVLFEFTNWGVEYIEELEYLKRYGIHGKYLKPNDTTIYTF